MFEPTIYILCSKPHGRLYIGVTSDLPARMFQHKEGIGSKHTAYYDIKCLVWLDTYPTMMEAIQREKTMKQWVRQWKIDLVSKVNPNWYEIDPVTGDFIIDDGRDWWDGS